MLSKEQQEIIENSLWVVNTALKKQGLQSDEDLRQSAMLYMCRCMERFDPTKNIKWTTFAYKNVYLYIKRMHLKEVRRQHNLVPDELCIIVEEDLTPSNILTHNTTLILGEIKAHCTPIERKFIDLKLRGYKGAEISEIMHVSTSKVVCCMKSVKEKARNIEKIRG